MSLMKQEIDIEEDIDFKLIWQNNAQGNGRHQEVCPDCGAPLRMDGGCRFCAYCGWSTCA